MPSKPPRTDWLPNNPDKETLLNWVNSSPDKVVLLKARDGDWELMALYLEGGEPVTPDIRKFLRLGDYASALVGILLLHHKFRDLHLPGHCAGQRVPILGALPVAP